MPIDDLMLGLAELRDSFDTYQEAEHYYEGSNPELFASHRIARVLRPYEDHFRLNLAAIPVDSLAHRLEIAAVTITTDDEEVTEDETLTQRLQDEIRDMNNMELEEPLVHLKASMFGDAYVIVSRDEDETGDAFVDIYYNTPYETRIVYDRSGRRKLFAIKSWSEREDDGAEFQRADLYYPDVFEQWITKRNAKGTEASDWEPYGEGTALLLDVDGEPLTSIVGYDGEGKPIEEPLTQAGVFVHDYGQIPVFHFRNDRPYGRAEHRRAFGAQDVVNKLMISHIATIDFQSFPQRYALKDPNAAEADAEDWDDDDASGTTTTTPGTKLKAGPGELWWLEGAKQVGQFEVADADAFLKPFDRVVRTMSTLTETPLHLFDQSGEPPSGESRRTAEAGQTKKVKTRQKQFGATWRDVYAFAMFLLTDQDFNDRINVNWVPAESMDEAEAWDLANKKKVVGLPLIQVLLEQGYTEDEITRFKEQWEEEQKQRIEMQRASFQASMQERRDDRPSTPNPDAPDEEE